MGEFRSCLSLLEKFLYKAVRQVWREMDPNDSHGLMLSCDATRFAFDFNDVLKEATTLANEPFDDGHEKVPEALRKLEFAKWAMITPIPEKALWVKEGLPFGLNFSCWHAI